MKFDVVVEKGRDMVTARIEDKGKLALLSGWGDNTELALRDLLEMIKDYQKHEGKDDKFWKKVDTTNIKFHIRYDLQVFFEEHDYLNITAIAKRAALNPGLLRQYASGVKHPSMIQAIKIEKVIHRLAKEMQEVSLFA